MTVSERDRDAGAGCLIFAGFLGLEPAFLVGGWIVWNNASSGLGSVQFNSFSAFWNSMLSLVRARSSFAIFEALTLLMIVGYIVILWQWIAVTAGWRTLVSERRVWAVSSAYFIVLMIILVSMSYREFQRLNEHKVPYNFGERLTWSVLICLVPAGFISITVPLWLTTPKSRDDPADSATQSH